jgi:serine protease inhibitor
VLKSALKATSVFQAVLDVNSGGVEAAAATGITVTLYSAFRGDHEIYIDSPFLHFIVEKPTRMIIFAGFVTDPKE